MARATFGQERGAGHSVLRQDVALPHQNEISADVIRAKKVVITNNSGDARAVLTSTEDGGVGLILLDETGKQRAEFVHTVSQESAVKFRAADGTPRVQIHAEDNGVNSITLHDRQGALRIGLWAKPDDSAYVTVHDRNKVLRVAMSAESDYSAAVTVLDDDGKPRATISLLPSGETALIIVDENQNQIAKIP